MYQWLMFGHLLGVVLLVTGWGLYVATVNGYRRAATIAQLHTLAGLTSLGERVLIGGGVLLVGFGLALAGQYYAFSHGWIVTALGLLAVQGILGATIVGPRVRRLHTALTTTAEDRSIDALALLARDRALHVANRASIPLLVDLEFLMTIKPATTDIILSLVAVVVLALALSWPVLREPSGQATPLATPPRA